MWKFTVRAEIPMMSAISAAALPSAGAAPLPADLEAFFSELGFLVIQGYGLTETAPIVTLNHPFHARQGSVGRPIGGEASQVPGHSCTIIVTVHSVGPYPLRGTSTQPRRCSGRSGRWSAT